IQPLAILACHLFLSKDASRQQYRRQHFVQIVRDAACQSTNGLHTLRTEELRLDQCLFGNVGVDDQRRLRMTSFVTQDSRSALDADLPGLFSHLTHLSRTLAVLSEADWIFGNRC